MKFIPKNRTINVGDTVLSSALDDFIPPNLIIGTIEEVFANDESLFQEALVAPQADLGKLSIVSILIR